MFNTSCGGDPLRMQWLDDWNFSLQTLLPNLRGREDDAREQQGNSGESSRVVPSGPSPVFFGWSQVGCLQSQQTIWAEHPPKLWHSFPLGPSKATRRAISVTWRALGFGTSSKGSRALDATLSCRRSAWGRVAINSFLSDKLMGRIKKHDAFWKTCSPLFDGHNLEISNNLDTIIHISIVMHWLVLTKGERDASFICLFGTHGMRSRKRRGGTTSDQERERDEWCVTMTCKYSIFWSRRHLLPSGWVGWLG